MLQARCGGGTTALILLTTRKAERSIPSLATARRSATRSVPTTRLGNPSCEGLSRVPANFEGPDLRAHRVIGVCTASRDLVLVLVLLVVVKGLANLRVVKVVRVLSSPP
jgi:hypothetical protein